MTSGASAANSAACLRIWAASAAPQRVSMRTLRPMAHPSSDSSCKNAPCSDEIAASHCLPQAEDNAKSVADYSRDLRLAKCGS